MTLEQALELAVQHHQAGRVREAEGLYLQILTAQPNHADALHLLGVLSHQSGRTESAIQLIRRAGEIRPDVPAYFGNLGIILAGLGRFEEAIDVYRKAIELQPDAPEVRDNLAGALLGAGRLEEAAGEYRRSLALKHDNADTHNNLGHTLRLLGRHDEAMAELRLALSLRPNSPQAYNNLGNVWHEKGDFDQAILAYGHALALQPNSADTLANLALSLKRRGDLGGAIEAYRKTAVLRPEDSEVRYHLGECLRTVGRLDEAAEAYRQALALKPDHTEAYNSLGMVYSELGLIDDAIAAYRRAAELRPDLAGALNNLGNALKDTGDFAGAIECYRRALEIEPNSYVAGNLLYTLHFDPHFDARAVADEHAEWNRIYAKPLAASIRPHDNDPSPDRRLRIGYVSRDLRVHPVGRFVAPLLSHHDHEQFEIFGYCDVARPDALTERLRGAVDTWRDTAGLSDESLAEQVRSDRIDILVDLAMHMDGTRMLTFARKPAPVQVTFLAYVSTTGLETMDYRLTDPYLDPPDVDESIYSEKSVRLPHSYWCYQPPEGTPPVNALPALAEHHITFGCLNNFAKISARTFDTWVQILQRVPDSQVVLHCGEGSHRQRVLERLASAGIVPGRVHIVGRLPLDEYFLEYHRIDIALDPFPYPGGTTTCDALWMGVPVVTLAGKTGASRGGVSILSNAGMPQFIAESTEQYAQIACSLAGDPSRLDDLRSQLRQRMAGSPLMNAKQFAAEVEAALRWMWRRQVGHG
jgi:predicted O-linked N-acetylglucosamine transferase (SPINDLY family)